MRKSRKSLSHRNLILRAGSAVASCIILAATKPAQAVDHTWTGNLSNSWHTAGNWNPLTVPTTADVVILPDLGGPYSITSNAALAFSAASITISTPDSFTLLAPLGQNIFLQNGDLTRTSAAAGTHNINARVFINANAAWSINGTGILNVPVIFENVPGLSFTKTGTGILNISSSSFASNYSGGTNVNAGILRVGANGLGFGTVSIATGATLQFSVDTDRTLVLNGSGVGGDGALVAIGSAEWQGDVTLSTNSTVGVGSSVDLTISGIISDGASSRTLTKVGAGQLWLSGANTYDGGTTVSEGSLHLLHNSAAGTGSITVSNGATVRPGTNDLTIPNHVNLNGTGVGGFGALVAPDIFSTWDGNINLQSNSSIGADIGELLITGNIGGAFALTKSGLGRITIASTNNITGQLLVSQGTLKVRHPLATSTAGTVVSAGATVEVQETIANAGITVSRPLSLNGTGVDGEGALRNISSNNTWSGAVTLQSNTTIGADAGQLTISGPISGAFNITKVGPGAVAITSSSNTYGNTIVDDGTLIVGSSVALPAAGILNVHSGGTAQISGPATFSRNFILNGQGFNSGGALRSTSSNVNWNNALTLQSDSAIGVDAGELRILGGISGIYALTKVGLGKLSFPAANSYTGRTDVNAGVLSMEVATGIPPASATTVLNGAALEVRGGFTAANDLRLNGMGVLNAGALRNAAGNNTWSGPITLQSDSAIGADAGTQLTISGVISDVGNGASLSKSGAGTLVLTVANTYKGGTFINGGTLSVSTNDQLGASTGAVTTNNGGKLLVTGSTTTGRTFNLNTGSLQVNDPANLTYTNATVNGGFLRGPGRHTIGANSGFSGVTALNGTNIVQTFSTTLTNFTNAGTLTANNTLTWDGGFNTSAGQIFVNAAFNTQGFENDGVMYINAAGNVTNSTSPFVSGGGARVYINPGGVLNLGVTTLELNGSLIQNNGTINGLTHVNYGSLAKGDGIYGEVDITDGGKFSPGNSPGTVITGSTKWNSGGNYVVEIGNSVHDMWLIDGKLNLNASSAHPFTISLSSLEGLVFDPTRDQLWPVLYASGGIIGLDASNVVLNASDFTSDIGSGHFFLESTSTDLAIHFSAVPEPQALALIFAGTLCAGRRRRSRA